MLRTETGEREQRWVEHLSKILNRDHPTNPVEEDEVVETEEIEEIDLRRWRLQEVKEALKRTKPGKGAGVDEVCPELSRGDMEDTAIRLTSCYNRLWDLRGGRKCGRSDLSSRYSRKVICTNVTTGEE